VDLPNSTDATTVNNAFKTKGYIENNGTLLGSTPISLAITNGDSPVDLTVQNTNITVSLDANTQIKKNDTTTNYSGVLSVPVLQTITSVNDTPVISSFNVGSTTEPINLV
jgi:hypothetical protein